MNICLHVCLPDGSGLLICWTLTKQDLEEHGMYGLGTLGNVGNCLTLA